MSYSFYAKQILDAINVTPEKMYDVVGSGFLIGVVESVEPLLVRIDSRTVLDEDFIYLSPFCKRAEFDNYRETYLKEGGSGDAEFASHSHKFHVGLWRGLRVGDELIITMSSDKQKYLANYRINMVFGDMAE